MADPTLTNERSAHLPSEILSDILSRLPTKSILRFKSVCKTWYCLIKDEYFIALHLNRSSLHQSFVLLKQSPHTLLMIDNEGSKVGEITICDPLVPAVTGTLDGLLCLASTDNLDPVLVWNPVTRHDYILLPKSDFCTELPIADHRVDIGFDSSSGKYKAVRVYNDFILSFAYKFEIISLGENQWRKLDTPFDVHEVGKGTSIFDNGYFHWIVMNENLQNWDDVCILSLDIVSEQFRMISLPTNPKLPPCQTERIKWKLLKSGNCLFVTALDNHVRVTKRRRHGYQLMHVWKMKMVMYGDEGGLRLYYLRTCCLCTPPNLSYTDLISEGDGFYLLKACGGFNSPPRLVKCFTKTKTYLELGICGSFYYHTATFKPSFVSPRAVLGLEHYQKVEAKPEVEYGTRLDAKRVITVLVDFLHRVFSFSFSRFFPSV